MILRKIYKFLSSVKLAMGLLITILVCCIAGVTVFSYERAMNMIFATLWFNGLLVLLVLNVAFCFFGRMWGRKVTFISFGMILFHLSFVAMLTGIVYNSFFYFRGGVRLTEGETLPSGQRQSYDFVEHGRFFNYSWLRGETKLIKVLREYKIDGIDKKWAYEIEVGDARSAKRGTIYVTKSLDYNGVGYYNDKEGYSILTILYDKEGREIYGVHVPLQSLKQADNSYLYTTGSSVAPGSFSIPDDSEKPLFALQVLYNPSKLDERGGEVIFRTSSIYGQKKNDTASHITEGKGPVGEKVRVGDYYLEAKEVRYWAGMVVRFEPGKPIVLTSLWVGLSGMVITFVGRMRKKSAIS